MIDFPIVDSHFHVWDTGRLRYPWLDNRPILNKPFLLADYRSACEPFEVESMVYVDVTSSDYRREVEWITELAGEDPRIQGIVSWAPLDRGRAGRSELEALAANPLVKGVRWLIQKEPDPEFCLRPDFVEGVKMLDEFNLVYDLGVLHFQMENVIRLVQQCPRIRFAIEHIGQPDIKGRSLDPWRAHLRTMSEMPNVWCKISGLVTKADWQSWKPEDLQPYVDHVLACFGFGRVMFGSDWPPVTQVTGLKRWIDVLDAALSGCSAADQRALFHDNAIDFYGL